MSFEQAYEKYMNGTASAEEVEFVEAEIAKARKLTEIMESNKDKVEIAEAEDVQVKRAKKAYSFKTAVQTLIIVLAVIFVAAGAVCGGVFGTAVSSAKNNVTVGQEEAKNIAVRYVNDNFGYQAGDSIVAHTEKDLFIGGNLTNSYYYYSVTVVKGLQYEIELEIDSRNGSILSIDVDTV